MPSKKSPYKTASQIEQGLQKDLSLNKPLYEILVHASPIAIVTLDLQHRILACNPAFEALFGYTQAEVLGRDLDDLITNSEVHDEALALTQKTKQGNHIHTFGTRYRKDGSAVEVEIFGVPIFDEEKQVGIYALYNDISILRQTQRSLERKANQQEQLIQAARQLTSSLNLNEVLTQVAQGAREILQASGCTLYRLESDGETLTPLVSIDPLFAEEILASPLHIDHSLTGSAVKYGRAMIYNTPLEVEYAYQIPGTPVEEQRIIVVPLFIDDKIIGAMCVDRQNPPFTEEDLALAETFAAYASSVLKNAQAYQQLKQEAEKRSQAEKALRFERQQILSIFNSIGEAIYVSDPHTYEILFVNETLQRQLNKTKKDLLGKLCYREFQGKEAPCEFCTNEIILKKKGKPHIWEHHNPLTQRDHLLVDRIIRWVDGRDVRFEFAVDITERAQRQRELESIAELTTALRLAQSNHEIISTVLDHAHSVFQAESTAIGLLDPARNQILFDHIRGSFAHLRGLRIPADQGISGATLRSRQPYLTQDASQDPLFLSRDQAPPNSCLAALPLFAKDLPIGVLLTLRQAPFSQTDLRLLTAFAEIAANAIHRASLHEETQRRLQHLSALHNIDLAITSNLDLDTTLQVILSQVTSQLNIHAADILLFDPPSQTLIYAAGTGFHSNAILSTALRIGAGLAGKAALSRQTILLPDISLQDPPTPGPKQLKTLEGFVSYAAVPLIAKDQVKGVLEIYHRSPLSPSPDWLDLLNTLATQAAIAIDNASLFDNLQRSHRELQLAYDATLQGWANALELRDKETEGHSQRVTQMTLALAQTLHFPDDQLVHLRRGALLHDIGKMAIPDSILLKPAPLSEDEWTLMRQHPTFAYQLLSPIAFLHPALDIPYCHHEKWDGSGYPQGLKGEQIPLPARIFAVVDVFDALTSERPYRPAWTRQEAIRYIREQAGIHFDPKVVKAFLKVVDTFE